MSADILKIKIENNNPVELSSLVDMMGGVALSCGCGSNIYC